MATTIKVISCGICGTDLGLKYDDCVYIDYTIDIIEEVLG